MLTRLRQFLELIRFSHTLFALPFALLAAVMAWKLKARELEFANWVIDFHNRMAPPLLGGDGEVLTIGGIEMVGFRFEEPLPAFRWKELLGILLCMVFARSTAMAFNRIADWRIDADNPRTKLRHIPAGILGLWTVALFASMSAAAFIGSTLLFWPNRLPFYLSVPVLAFLLGYSYAKRFTALAHFWLGAALMLAPVSAWIAIRGQEVMQSLADLRPAAVLGGAVLLWVAGFDVIYACQDYEFDRQRGLFSIPAKFGVPAALRIAAVCHAGTLILLFLLPSVYPLFGWVYYSGVTVVAGLLIYEHALVSARDLSRVNRAFFNVNAIVSIGLLLVGIVDLFR